MWWRSSALFAALFAGLAALALAGCGFQPLYGGTTAGGAKARRGHGRGRCHPDSGPRRAEAAQRADLRQYRRRQRGPDPLPARHRHQGERDRPAGADHRRRDRPGLPARRDASSSSTLPSGKVVLQGKAISRAPYNRFQEIFANVRARYDAENRAARTMSESIKTQVAAYLSQRRLGFRSRLLA